jgi:phosphoribosylformimino-5-aminoimidazole carboxamide ribotide isomerase
MDLYAAVDLRGGSAVRLVQGDFDRETSFGDPLALAREFAAAGAPWLHVVDLEGARTGRPVERATVAAIAAAVDVPVQAGGGVRRAQDVDELLSAGVARVVVGTAALEEPDRARALAEAHPGRVALGLDYRPGPDGTREVAGRGWTEGSGRSLAEVLDAFAAVPLGAVVVTNIDRDGTLTGPDLAGLADVLTASPHPVVASGGVGSAADLRALAGLSAGHRTLAGVVVGRALVDGRVAVGEAVTACAASG